MKDSESVTIVDETTSDPLDEKLVAQHFEQYLERRLQEEAPYLLPGAVPPEGWLGMAEELEMIIARELEKFRARCEHDFDVAILGRGWSTGELAGVEKPPTLSLTTGRVRTPAASTISAALEQRASEALRELRRRHLKLEEPVLQQALELAAAGAWTSQSSTVEAAVRAAETAIGTHDREHVQARAEADARPWLVVHVPFRGPGGRQFAAGRSRVDPELVTQLREWAVKVESNARGKSLASIGYPTWPVFSVEAD